MTEADAILILCGLLLNGEPEKRVPFEIAERASYVQVDCMTDTFAVEVGLDDRRSSLDSVQQALFASDLTNKEPMVILVDTNGIEDVYEYRIKTSARAADVSFVVIDEDLLRRYQMTQYFRDAQARGVVLAPKDEGS